MRVSFKKKQSILKDTLTKTTRGPEAYLMKSTQKYDKTGKPIGKPKITGGPMKQESISEKEFNSSSKKIRSVNSTIKPYKVKVSTPTGKSNIYTSNKKFGGPVSKKKK
jgi:hypothetical protein